MSIKHRIVLSAILLATLPNSSVYAQDPRPFVYFKWVSFNQMLIAVTGATAFTGAALLDAFVFKVGDVDGITDGQRIADAILCKGAVPLVSTLIGQSQLAATRAGDPSLPPRYLGFADSVIAVTQGAMFALGSLGCSSIANNWNKYVNINGTESRGRRLLALKDIKERQNPALKNYLNKNSVYVENYLYFAERSRNRIERDVIFVRRLKQQYQKCLDDYPPPYHTSCYAIYKQRINDLDKSIADEKKNFYRYTHYASTHLRIRHQRIFDMPVPGSTDNGNQLEYNLDYFNEGKNP